jgi:tryptophan synthase alpha chain
MQRIKELFSTQKAFVAYLTAGDSSLEKTFESAKALIAGGVNLLELGVPFSDPAADGPTIQQASQRALKNHTSLLDVLDLAQQLRKITNIPIILFTYFNPLLHYMPVSIFEKIKLSGIDGILVVDLPLEESQDYQKQCLTHDLAPIYVVTPITPDERLKQISKQARGFLYYACRLGTTGVKTDIPLDLDNQIQRIKQKTDLPVVVGFGISTQNQVNAIVKCADGFVIGSLFVDAIEKNISLKNLTALAASLGEHHALST